jgi:AraC family transcriptional regulator
MPVELLDGTLALHSPAIERVIGEMHGHIYEPFSLEDMADIACLSSSYFNRTFRQIIGIPPGEFLAALRLDAARRLLLTTALPVTDICFSVGYTSLGTFTTRFTQLIGLSPQQMRRFMQRCDPASFATLIAVSDDISPIRQPLHSVAGTISIPHDFNGIICVGLFSKPLPQCRPVRCAKLTGSGSFLIPQVPDGAYYVLSAGMPAAGSMHHYLMPDQRWHVGAGVAPVTLRHGIQHGVADVVLHAPRLTDPPVLVALPYLLASAFLTVPVLSS